MQYLLGIIMFLTALFLILLVLVQRGRGGGLAGAFGGAGGQSAFGTKAGDMFTKITIGTAAFWILIAALSVRLLNAPKTSVLGDSDAPPTVISPLAPPDEGGGGLDASSGLGADGLPGSGPDANGLEGGGLDSGGLDAGGAAPAAGTNDATATENPAQGSSPAETPDADVPSGEPASP